MEANENVQEKEVSRDKRKIVLQKFNELKQLDQLNKENLSLLLNNCETIEEIIVYYLDYLKETKDNDYIHELLGYYKIISPKYCLKHNIKKISEKKRFHDLINIILTSKNINVYVRKELSTIDSDVIHIYNELKKDQKYSDNFEEKDFIRWDTIYNFGIDLNDIYNEEYFYYSLSNSLLRDYEEGYIGVDGRKGAINEFYEVFKFVEKDKKLYQKYFEYICLGLLNVSMKNNNENEILRIIDSIRISLSKKYLDLKGIKKILDKKGIKYSIDGNNITLQYGDKNFLIDNYKNYNFDELILPCFLTLNKRAFKEALDSKRNFDFYLKKDNYFDGLLIKVFLNYSKSNLLKNSIEKLFKIRQSSYPELFEQITTDKILDYIVFLPYNNYNDTARTLKIYKKIIIDTSKNVFNQSLKLNSEKLKTSLSKFANIVKRKFNFEHELQYLVTILLFYLYANTKRRINSIPREIKDSEIKFLEENEYNKIKNEEGNNKYPNIVKEAGYSFEKFCYGEIQKKFYIKQLLFIANEKNDELNCKEYKEQYLKCSEEKLENILKNFPQDQILSPLVEQIKEGLEEEKNLILEYEKKAKSDDNILNDFITKAEDELSFTKDFENLEVDIGQGAYNNYVYDRRNDD